VTELSLDHDPGLGDEVSERTGYIVLLWLKAEEGTGRGGPSPEQHGLGLTVALRLGGSLPTVVFAVVVECDLLEPHPESLDGRRTDDSIPLGSK